MQALFVPPPLPSAHLLVSALDIVLFVVWMLHVLLQSMNALLLIHHQSHLHVLPVLVARGHHHQHFVVTRLLALLLHLLNAGMNHVESLLMIVPLNVLALLISHSFALMALVSYLYGHALTHAVLTLITK